MDWTFAPFERNDYKSLKELPQKPLLFDEMLNVARALSKDFKFVRVDLYEVMNKIYFSEMTFYPSSGFMKFNPAEWDTNVGSMLKL